MDRQPGKFYARAVRALVHYGKHHFGLSRPTADGHSISAHLAAAARQGAKVGKVAKPPPKPPGLDYLWQAFQALHSTRPVGFAGPLPITFGEIDAWQRVSGFLLLPWEVEALKQLDGEFLLSYNTRADAPRTESKDKPRRGR